jgi:hypothetical protein
VGKVDNGIVAVSSLWADEREKDLLLGPGAAVVVPAAEARGVKTRSRLIAIHMAAPPPDEADDALVTSGLERGPWH